MTHYEMFWRALVRAEERKASRKGRPEAGSAAERALSEQIGGYIAALDETPHEERVLPEVL